MSDPLSTTLPGYQRCPVCGLAMKERQIVRQAAKRRVSEADAIQAFGRAGCQAIGRNHYRDTRAPSSDPAAPARRPPPPGCVQWEYRVATFGNPATPLGPMLRGSHPVLHSELNAAGGEGWELVAVTAVAGKGDFVCVFKRPVITPDELDEGDAVNDDAFKGKP